MRRALATLVIVLFAAVPASAQAETVYETVRVPTVNGDSLHVEIARPAGRRVPVILTYSPYNTLAEGTTPNLANDELGQRYVPRNYARAVADVIGTRTSTGCWDYGGRQGRDPGAPPFHTLAPRPPGNG